MSGIYDLALKMFEWLEERGLKPVDWCVHSKYVPGCPACTQHWLKYHGITVTRWNPDVYERVTRP